MSGFSPIPARHNTLSTVQLPEEIPSSLSSCPVVLVRKDGQDVVSVQRLKPAITSDEETPALPPRRGRPPRPAAPVPPA